MLLCDLGKNLAVDCDVGDFQHIDEPGVAQAEFVNCGVDLYGPKGTESALLGTAVAESVHTSLEHCRTSETNLALTTPLIALYASKQVLSTFCMLGTSFDAWHNGNLGEIVWHHRFQSATDGDAKADVATLVSRSVAGFTGVKVALASFSLDHEAGSCDTNAFGHRFVGLHCHTWVSKMCEG